MAVALPHTLLKLRFRAVGLPRATCSPGWLSLLYSEQGRGNYCSALLDDTVSDSSGPVHPKKECMDDDCTSMWAGDASFPGRSRQAMQQHIGEHYMQWCRFLFLTDQKSLVCMQRASIVVHTTILHHAMRPTPPRHRPQRPCTSPPVWAVLAAENK